MRDEFIGGFLIGMLVLVLLGNLWDLALIYLAKRRRCPYCRNYGDRSCVKE